MWCKWRSAVQHRLKFCNVTLGSFLSARSTCYSSQHWCTRWTRNYLNGHHTVKQSGSTIHENSETYIIMSSLNSCSMNCSAGWCNVSMFILRKNHCSSLLNIECILFNFKIFFVLRFCWIGTGVTSAFRPTGWARETIFTAWTFYSWTVSVTLAASDKLEQICRCWFNVSVNGLQKSFV